jgi:hypothetical protein
VKIAGNIWERKLMRGLFRGNAGVQPNLKARAAELEKAHRDTIVKNVEHRLQVARNRGDERLVRILEAELKQFA